MNDECREPDEPRDLLAEAFAIADGRSMLLGSTAHVKALVEVIRRVTRDLETTKGDLNDLTAFMLGETPQ